MGLIPSAPKGVSTFALQVPALIIERDTGRFITQDELKRLYPSLTFAPEVETKWVFGPNQLTIEWHTPVSTFGFSHLSRATRSSSQPQPEKTIKNWTQFKAFAIAQEQDRYVYRGQENSGWAIAQPSIGRAGMTYTSS